MGDPHVVLGEPLLMACVVGGASPPPRIHWRLGNQHYANAQADAALQALLLQATQHQQQQQQQQQQQHARASLPRAQQRAGGSGAAGGVALAVGHLYRSEAPDGTVVTYTLLDAETAASNISFRTLRREAHGQPLECSAENEASRTPLTTGTSVQVYCTKQKLSSRVIHCSACVI